MASSSARRSLCRPAALRLLAAHQLVPESPLRPKVVQLAGAASPVALPVPDFRREPGSLPAPL
ncbi:MAG: hypothetical protein WB579_02600 [Bryobacteraceae bacterium]